MGEKYDEKFTEDAEFKKLYDAVKFFSEHDLTVKSKKEFEIMEEFIIA